MSSNSPGTNGSNDEGSLQMSVSIEAVPQGAASMDQVFVGLPGSDTLIFDVSSRDGSLAATVKFNVRDGDTDAEALEALVAPLQALVAQMKSPGTGDNDD